MKNLILSVALGLACATASAASDVKMLMTKTHGGYVVLIAAKLHCEKGRAATFTQIDLVGSAYISDKGCWSLPTSDSPHVRVVWTDGSYNDYLTSAFEE